MKPFLSALLVFGWLANASAAGPKPIAVTVGQEFQITLPSNPTTGYQWVLSKPPDEKLVRTMKSHYKAPDSKLAGAGGTMAWTFRALAKGKTEMQLNYARPWEKHEKPAQTTNFVVVIKAGRRASKPGS